MALDLADEIVQDFLVEAGEILDQLGEQLVELEGRPRDKELLNTVFRGFHTIKGGAGFLGLVNLVELCHRAEDVFNLLRQGERQVDASLMDVVLRALDVVHGMFGVIRQGQEPEPASRALLAELGSLLQVTPPAVAAVTTLHAPAPVAAAAPAAATVAVTDGAAGGDEISDAEFEALLDALAAPAGGAPAVAGVAGPAAEGSDRAVATAVPAGPEPPVGSGDTITDAEFEALLDQLHGAGAPGRAAGSAVASPPGPAEPAPQAAAKGSPVAPPAAGTAAGESAGPAEGRAAADSAAKVAVAEGKGTPADSTVRVDTEVLDHIMNMVGELVLARNRLVALDAVNADEELAKAVANLDVVTADLQAGVMRTRMQPIKKVFGRFPRVIRDLARTLDKEVVLEMQGEDTDLDKNLVEALADPLVHLVRNAVDHGIEAPAVREARGKPRRGTVLLAAEQEGDHILLTIADDGAGMDAEVLRRKAVEKGLMDFEAAARLDDKECYNLIFAAGFSTKEQISDVSGRGVGMDVVKTRIAQLNGSIDIDSRPGLGTTLYIKVPLTLAIVPTLMVVLGRQIFAIPLVNVSEIFNLERNRTNVVDGRLVVRVRDKPLPLFYLNRWLARPAAESEGGAHVVVVQVGTQQLCFVVDQLLGQEEVVIKPLGALLHGTRGLAGATITGDGRIALILDVPSLVKAYAGRC